MLDDQVTSVIRPSLETFCSIQDYTISGERRVTISIYRLSPLLESQAGANSPARHRQILQTPRDFCFTTPHARNSRFASRKVQQLFDHKSETHQYVVS